jgi:hypothetical protein
MSNAAMETDPHVFLGLGCWLVAGSYYEVEIAQHYDGKFREAPGAALEIDLAIEALFSWLSTICFGMPVAILAPKHVPRPQAAYCLATIFGGASTCVQLFFPVMAFAGAALVLYELRTDPSLSPAPVQ